MEILDEFDSEFPQSVTFCQRISEEAFERQAATYTERALRRLFRSLDRNPALAERVVRKDKQAECERRGLLSFLWVRGAGGAAGGWGRRGGSPAALQGGTLGMGGGEGGRAWAQLGLQSWGFEKPEASQLGECIRQAGGSPVQLPSSCPTSPAAVAGEVLLCSPGGAELLQQHGRRGDAPTPGAPEEEHPPCAPLLPE